MTVLEEGWYLMTADELERELARLRDPARPPTGVPRLSVEEALAYRDAGNLPDERGRTLRLVLHNDRPGVPGALEERRLRYEPDFHDAPSWRRPGSARVNVVPLRTGAAARRPPQDWRDDPALASLEAEWRATGAVAGVRVLGEWRGFVFKTVLALRAEGRDVSVVTVTSSIARWLPPEDAARLRAALEEANP